MREGTASRPAAALPVASGREVSALLWRMLRGRRWALAGVLALFLVEAALALVFPLVAGSLVDAVIAAAGSGVPASFWVQAAILAASALAGAAVTWAGGSRWPGWSRPSSPSSARTTSPPPSTFLAPWWMPPAPATW